MTTPTKKPLKKKIQAFSRDESLTREAIESEKNFSVWLLMLSFLFSPIKAKYSCRSISFDLQSIGKRQKTFTSEV